MRLAVVGATGAVGTEIMSILEERDTPIDELVPVASPRSAGRKLPFRGDSVRSLRCLRRSSTASTLRSSTCRTSSPSSGLPSPSSRGATVVDNSGAWRMDPDVPLAVPEVNPDAINDRPKGIIASPNCTTLAMVVPLGALHREADVERLITRVLPGSVRLGPSRHRRVVGSDRDRGEGRRHLPRRDQRQRCAPSRRDLPASDRHEHHPVLRFAEGRWLHQRGTEALLRDTQDHGASGPEGHGDLCPRTRDGGPRGRRPCRVRIPDHPRPRPGRSCPRPPE